MVGAIVQHCLDTNYRICRQRSSAHGLLNTFFYCREESFWNSTAYHSFFKFQSLTITWFKLNPNIAKLTMSASLLMNWDM